MPGIYPDTPATGLQPGGHITPGETSLQAAARRYHERKRRESSFSAGELDPEASRKDSDPQSTEQPLVQDIEKTRRESQISTDSAGKSRRGSSLSEYWHEFRHNFP